MRLIKKKSENKHLSNQYQHVYPNNYMCMITAKRDMSQMTCLLYIVFALTLHPSTPTLQFAFYTQ